MNMHACVSNIKCVKYFSSLVHFDIELNLKSSMIVECIKVSIFAYYVKK